MSPSTVLNPALYADRTVQDWHRNTFNKAAWAIDIDLLGACLICRTPLYLLESTTNPEKPVAIIGALSRLSGVPAFTILHHGGQILRADAIGGNARHEGETAVKTLLALARYTHTLSEHPQQLVLLRQLERDL